MDNCSTSKCLYIYSSSIDPHVDRPATRRTSRRAALELHDAYVSAGHDIRRCYMWAATTSSDIWCHPTTFVGGEEEVEALLQTSVRTRRTIRQQVERDMWVWDTWSPGLLDKVLEHHGAQGDDRVQQFLSLRVAYSPDEKSTSCCLTLLDCGSETVPAATKWWWQHFYHMVPATQHGVDEACRRVQETQRVLRAPRAACGYLPVDRASTVVCRDPTSVRAMIDFRHPREIKLCFLNPELALVAHATQIVLPFMHTLAKRSLYVYDLARHHVAHYAFHLDGRFKFSVSSCVTPELLCARIRNYWELHYEDLKIETLYEQIRAAASYFQNHVWCYVYITSSVLGWKHHRRGRYSRDWRSALLWANVSCYSGQVPPKDVLVRASLCWMSWNVVVDTDMDKKTLGLAGAQ